MADKLLKTQSEQVLAGDDSVILGPYTCMNLPPGAPPGLHSEYWGGGWGILMYFHQEEGNETILNVTAYAVLPNKVFPSGETISYSLTCWGLSDLN